MIARRSVPPEIPAPEYARSGWPSGPGPVKIYGEEELDRLRRACRAAAKVLKITGAAVREGVSTDELDAIAHEETLKAGAYPSCLNYKKFPKSCCTSINEVICHGIPDGRKLQSGDIITVDVTVFLEGMHGDCASTYFVGEVDEASKRLVKVTHECLYLGINAVRTGRPISDIGRAIETHARRHGLGVVRAFCGHGIGEKFHNELQVPHYFDPKASRIMREGMTFTIEPMITLGSPDHSVLADNWTAVTRDGSRCAQFEHTIAVTDAGAEVLTQG
jgi:methionyl aminopeptidase